jgi:hypothetical protein
MHGLSALVDRDLNPLPRASCVVLPVPCTLLRDPEILSPAIMTSETMGLSSLQNGLRDGAQSSHQ